MGTRQNAVRIHLWVAICSYLTVAYIKHMLKNNLSIYEIMQILKVSTFAKTDLRELLTEQPGKIHVNQNVKEQLLSFG